MPTLDLQALKQRIAAKRLDPIYLFVGNDMKLMDRMVEAIEGTIEPADRPFAVDRFHAGEPGAQPVDMASAARVRPMLGDRRILVLLRAERLLKPKRAAKAQPADEADEHGDDEAETLDLQALEEYVAAPSPETTVVFVAAEIDRSRRFTKRLVEKAMVVEFSGLMAADGPSARTDTRAVAADWIQDELTRAGRRIDPDAARLLAERAGRDISKLRGDVERLLLFTEKRPRITVDDVREVVVDEQTVEDDWAVINAIAAGDAARALDETARRLDRGDSPHAIVGQLRWWVSTRLVEGDPARVKPALEILLRTDQALKSSGGEDRVLLERAVVELTGRPLPAQRWGGARR
jgi:DNA polymerase III delta subunit